MYHSITFGEKNTWDDWHLIPSSRPVFNPPSVRTNYIDVPGADGDLDFTEAISNRPLYTNREGDIEFIVENDFRDWAVAYSDISAYLHGQKMNAFLEDDPNYYYSGRFIINEWKSDSNWSTITINYNVLPFKYEKLSGVPGWTYDPYNHPKGVLNDYRKIKVTSGTPITEVAESRGAIVVPVFTVSNASGLNVQFTNPSGQTQTAQLQNGINRLTNIIVREGNNSFRFTGTGSIILDCRGGQL